MSSDSILQTLQNDIYFESLASNNHYQTKPVQKWADIVKSELKKLLHIVFSKP